MKRLFRFLINIPAWNVYFEQMKQVYRRGSFSAVMALIYRKLYPRIIEQENYETWIKEYNTFSTRQLAKLQKNINIFHYKPVISIVMPVYNTPPPYLTKAIDSIRAQIYPYWELCVADDASTDPSIKTILQKYESIDKRIKVIYRKENGHIIAASNSALELATGEFVAMVDHDDMLSTQALYWIVKELNDYKDTDLIYTDEDKIDAQDKRFDYTFKTDWNPLLILSVNYVNHLSVYRTALVKEVGGFHSGFQGSQDYDLLLRFIEKTASQRIRHIPRILYHWRALPESTAGEANQKPYAITSARKAIAAHLERQQITAGVIPNPYTPIWSRVCFSIPTPLPRIAIIIPTKDKVELLKAAITGILNPAKTNYENIEIIIVDNQSKEIATFQYFNEITNLPQIKIFTFDEPFNWARINNWAVKQTTAPYILFLNNDIEPIHADWLQEMISYMSLPEVGVVGAKLLYPDDSIQHAGVVLGIGGIAGHIHARCDKNAPGYNGCLYQARNVSAVTGACMLTRRSLFETLNGFDETLKVAFNDIEFCIRLSKAGYQIIWTPYAQIYHKESATRGPDTNPENINRFKSEIAYVKNLHDDLILNDPFYNPNLSLCSDQFALAFPPRTAEFQDYYG